MTSPCTRRTASTALTRTGAMVVVFGLALAPTAAAYAQATESSTVVAVINGGGEVGDIKVYGADGAQTPAADALPVTLGISQTVDGDASTTTYKVANTSVTKKAVEYIDADGKTATVEQDVALPLVGQLSVRLPASRTDVVAPGARVLTLQDGSHELLWSMVLFAPIGAPQAEVSYTAKGTGNPVARLEVATVNPNATPGLAGTAQAANATVNGNGILGVVVNGADEGLTKLSDGVGQLLAGLDKLEAGAIQLNEGIANGADGAEQLAVGSESAEAGSGKLAAGLGELSAGAGQLDTGTRDLNAGAKKLDAGAGAISAGLQSAQAGSKQLATGSKDLATGATAASAGAESLAQGLVLISGGLDQLASTAGLPAALDGAKKLRFGISHAPGTLGATDPGGLVEVLGSPTNPLTLLGGLVAVRTGVGGAPDTTATTPPETAVGGLEQIQRGLESALDPNNPQGLAALKAGAEAVAGGVVPVANLLGATCGYVTGQHAATPTATTGALSANCAGVTAALPTLTGGASSVAGGMATVMQSSNASLAGVTKIQAGLLGASAGLDKLVAGLTAVRAGVTSGDTSKPGIAEGLDGLVTGLTAAVTGLGQLAPGAKSAATGAAALAEGNAKIASGATAISAGNTSLAAGLTQLFTGSRALEAGTGALAAGTGKLEDGAGKLAAGAKAAASGAGELDAGIGKIADGQRQVADGLPAAVDGSGQLADGVGAVIEGEKAVSQGLSGVQSKAVALLESQFAQGTTLARQQLAGLDAATELANETAGAATTMYVLTQDTNGIVANLASSSSGADDSIVGRNVALGAGGALLLLGGVAGGFLSGRRQTASV